MANPDFARQQLGWQPKVQFHDLVRIMMDADLELTGLTCPGEGKKILAGGFNGWHHWEHQLISMER
jgi:GDPmannose 4,6-dehydratase